MANETRTKSIRLAVTEEELAQAHELARVRRRSLSDYLRELIFADGVKAGVKLRTTGKRVKR